MSKHSNDIKMVLRVNPTKNNIDQPKIQGDSKPQWIKIVSTCGGVALGGEEEALFCFSIVMMAITCVPSSALRKACSRSW